MYRNSRIHEQIFHFFTNSPTKISIFTNHERNRLHEITNEKKEANSRNSRGLNSWEGLEKSDEKVRIYQKSARI